MAVDSIKNKQVVSKENYNRGSQISTKNTTVRQERAQSILPGKDLTKNYAITLKDVDTSIMTHVKNVIKPSIREANEVIKIPVYYANEERWVSYRKRGVLRDKNDSLILPLIMLRRISVDLNEFSGQDFTHDIQQKYGTVLRNSKWSKNNRYDNFSVLTNSKPQYENILTSMPNFRNINYEFVVWTNYIEQMNDIVELFVEETNKYWGDAEEYKFYCTIDSIADASEMTVDDERFIKSTFTLITKAYLLPEYVNSVITNKISNIQKELTPTKVIFDNEIII